MYKGHLSRYNLTVFIIVVKIKLYIGSWRYIVTTCIVIALRGKYRIEKIYRKFFSHVDLPRIQTKWALWHSNTAYFIFGAQPSSIQQWLN